MKFGMLSVAGALVVAAVSVAAPTVSALPTGSAAAGDGREVVIIDGTLELSDLDSCWASGFPRDIRFENRSQRNFLVYASNDCTGEPTATVAPGGSETHYGWSAVAAN
ncbi:hypothetical protein [Nocardia australiensis]|uniref:hypothetical protein n=1 Tax=Nocardia australiensis TaxID=2887191 RepID=UPI001D142F61|nr:hypothetical protein [Nocardia australiensis]